VRVAVARQGDWATIEVRDHGIGLAAEEREKIFQKFYRVGEEMVRQTEGSVLPVPGARTHTPMGGSIAAESPGVGQAHLPGQPALARRGAGMSARILVVEDEKHLAEGISENLQQEGYAVETWRRRKARCNAGARGNRPHGPRRHAAQA